MELACPSRRQMIAASGGTAGLAFLAACGGGSDDSTASTSSSSASAPAAAGTTLAPLSDVAAGSAVSVTSPSGDKLVLFRPASGDPVAFSAVCPHAGGIVAPNTDGNFQCPLHGSRFDEATGDVINGPATSGLDSVAVKVDGDNIVTA